MSGKMSEREVLLERDIECLLSVMSPPHSLRHKVAMESLLPLHCLVDRMRLYWSVEIFVAHDCHRTSTPQESAHS